MIVHRCTWYYCASGQSFAKKISFETPVTASKVREVLKRTLGLVSVEIWSH